MKRWILLFAALTLAACGGTVSRLGPGKEIEAVRDFVAVSDLPEVDKLRLYDQIKFLYVNDHFVVIPQRRSNHLIEFKGRCDELRRRKWSSDMVDFRVSSRYLYADHDTIRGCVIGRIFELTSAQLEDLRELGDAPGIEVFIPENEES